MPGSNPLFGLNTLGGALSIQTKDGRTSPGTTVQAIYGSDVRRALEFEHGGSRASSGINWYVAGNLFAEDGWRDDSPSDVRQLFGKLGWGRGRSDVSVSLAYADNSLNGNGLQEIGFLERDYASVYTKPDKTDNRSTFLNVDRQRALERSRDPVSVNGYYRDIRHRHAQRRHQRGLARPVGLSAERRRTGGAAAAGYTSFPAVGATPATRRFRIWRCIANVLLNDEPAETCNGLDQPGADRSAQRRPVRAGHASRRVRARTSSPPAARSIAAASVSLSRPSSAT